MHLVDTDLEHRGLLELRLQVWTLQDDKRVFGHEMRTLLLTIVVDIN
jgi:hypothetical protein